jgi:hypothetical protein
MSANDPERTWASLDCIAKLVSDPVKTSFATHVRLDGARSKLGIADLNEEYDATEEVLGWPVAGPHAS